MSAERRGTPRRWKVGKDGRDAVRLTTTLSRRQYNQLQKLSEKHEVKLAWLVRYATQQLLRDAEKGTLQLDFGWGTENA